MQESILIPVKNRAKILVREGEKVKTGEPLFEIEEVLKKKTINLAEILKIKKEQIDKFLTKKIGEKVRKGEVIAEKKGFLGKFIVKSPSRGKIASINLKTGEVFIEERKRERELVNAPLSGRVRIKDGKIEILFEGEVFFGKSGCRQAEGELFKIEGEKIGVLQVPAQVSGKILLGLNFAKDCLPKIEALGGKGIITTHYSQRLKKIPYLVIKEKTFEKLKELGGKRAILDGEEKKLIVVY